MERVISVRAAILLPLKEGEDKSKDLCYQSTLALVSSPGAPKDWGTWGRGYLSLVSLKWWL